MKRIRKNIVSTTVSVITVLCLAAVLSVFLFFFQKPVVVISDNTRFPIGTAVTISDLVLEVKNGTLIDADELRFESHLPGEQLVMLSVKDRMGVVRQERFTIEFYDSDVTPPVITSPTELSVTEGEEINLLENVSAVDDNGDACTVKVDGTYHTDREGTYSLSFVSADRAGNAARKEFTLTVLPLPLPYDENGKLLEGTYRTKKGFSVEVKNGIAYAEGHLIVNKSYSLPKEYKEGDRKLTAEALAAYNKMRTAAAKDGITLFSKTGAQDWNDQAYLFNHYVDENGLEMAEIYSIRPGHSEHQSGYAIDFVVNNAKDAESEKNKAALQWLNENAYQYGFILRYPEGKTDETGYPYEPWHYRFVGEELSNLLYNNGNWITMEDYFGIDSVYRGYEEAK